MPEWSVRGWQEPWEFGEMRRYFALVVEPIIESVKACDESPEAAFAAKYLLDKVVWGVTTCVDKHKLNLRYVSEGAKAVLSALDAGSGLARDRKQELRKSLRHEHVVPRKAVVARLLNGDASALSQAVACVVTVDEHRARSGTS